MSSALAFYSAFNELKFWARDVIFIFPQKSYEGLEGWLNTYLTDRSIDSGTIQAAICLEIEGNYCDTGFDYFSVHLEGPNGLLPNLDMVNALVRLGETRNLIFGLQKSLPGWVARSDYFRRLWNIVGMLVRQGFGFPRFIHGPFLKARIDAITVRAVESKRREDEHVHKAKFKAFYETIEGTYRSLNNALEHLHQSFFFYLLPSSRRFISIANFLPLVGFLAAALLLRAAHHFYTAGSFAIISEAGLLVSMVLVNFLIWTFASSSARISPILCCAVHLSSPLVISRFLMALPFNRGLLAGVCTASLSVIVFSCAFLNFGLSVILGVTAFLFAHLPESKAIAMGASLLLPSSLLALLFRWVPAYTRQIALAPSEWNFGLPFYFIQPIFIVLLTLSWTSNNGNLKKPIKTITSKPKQL